MPGTTSVDNLPRELHNWMLSYLSAIDRIALKLTSVHFSTLIPKLSVPELLEVEESTFALDNELYGCYECLRLRLNERFADNQLKRQRRKFGSDARYRFCIECSLASRYVRGNQVAIRGVAHIVCMQCNRLRLMARDEGQSEYGCLCTNCWQPRQEARRRLERERIRAKQAERRERRRGLLGSDYEDSDDGYHRLRHGGRKP